MMLRGTYMIITITNAMEIIKTQKGGEALLRKEASLLSTAPWLVERNTGNVASKHAQLE